jgi:hypothetical protein
MNAFLLRPRPFAFHPHSDRLRCPAVFYFVSSAWSIADPQWECGWNAQGTRTQKEHVHVRNDIFTVILNILNQ